MTSYRRTIILCLGLAAIFGTGSARAADNSNESAPPTAEDIAVTQRRQQGEAWWQQAKALERAGRDLEAEALCQRIVVLPDSSDANPQPWRDEWQVRALRSSAQFSIGILRYGRGDYSGALDAFLTSRKRIPFPHWEGNAAAGDDYSHAMWEGACLEHLGRTSEIIPHYAAAAIYSRQMIPDDTELAFHLVDIYAANNRLEALQKFADLYDAQILQAYARGEFNDWARDHMLLDAHPLRRLLGLYELERKGDWAALITALDPTDQGSELLNNWEQDHQWFSEYAARLLARHAQQTVPLIVRDLQQNPTKNPAIRFYALSISGELGHRALEALETSEPATFRDAIQEWRSRVATEEAARAGIDPPLRPQLPPVGRVASLPSGEQIFTIMTGPPL